MRHPKSQNTFTFVKTKDPDVLKTRKYRSSRKFSLLKEWWLINRREKTLIRCTGVSSPWWKKVTDISNLSRITLTMEFEKGGESPFLGTQFASGIYPVLLEGDQLSLEIHQTNTYKEARELATTLALFFNVPLVDRISGVEIVRKPKYFNETFLERMKRARVKVMVPTPPANMKIPIHYVGTGIFFEIPGLLPTMYIISQEKIRREIQTTEWVKEIKTVDLTEFFFVRQLPGILIRSKETTMDIIVQGLTVEEVRYIYVLSKSILMS